MSTPRPLLRLKRSAAVALDELAVTLPPSKRTRIDSKAVDAGSTTPRTLRFRRLSAPSAQNRRVIDIDLSGLLDSPGPSPSPAAKAVPSKSNSSKSTDTVADASSSPTAEKDPEISKDEVFDLYEQIDTGSQPGFFSSGTRVGWLNSSTLPSELFGELLPSDDEDDTDYSGDEVSVDYPSTPSSSNVGSGDDCSDDEISDGEISALHAANPDWATVFGTRSRLRDRKFDSTSDSDAQPK